MTRHGRGGRRTGRPDALPLPTWLLVGVPPAAALVTAAALQDDDVRLLLLDEDRVYEWGQVVLYLGGAVVALVVAVQLHRRGTRWAAALWLLGAAALVGIAGEEIAWGQRIFGVDTPEALADVNAQDEITVHNIGGLSAVSAAVLFGTCVVAVLGRPVLARVAPHARPDVVDLLLPPTRLVTWFVVLPAWKLVRLVEHVVGDAGASDVAELGELCMAGGILLFAGAVALGPARRGAEPGGASSGRRDPIVAIEVRDAPTPRDGAVTRP